MIHVVENILMTKYTNIAVINIRMNKKYLKISETNMTYM